MFSRVRRSHLLCGCGGFAAALILFTVAVLTLPDRAARVTVLLFGVAAAVLTGLLVVLAWRNPPDDDGELAPWLEAAMVHHRRRQADVDTQPIKRRVLR